MVQTKTKAVNRAYTEPRVAGQFEAAKIPVSAGDQLNSHANSQAWHILSITLKRAAIAQAASVKRINLLIGDTRTDTAGLQFWFSLLSNGSLAEGAQLRFHHLHPVNTCSYCSFDFDPMEYLAKYPAPQKGHALQLARDNIFVYSVEVERSA
jgi:hydrogenase nickel incorporation protein HypA/HybF